MLLIRVHLKAIRTSIEHYVAADEANSGPTRVLH